MGSFRFCQGPEALAPCFVSSIRLLLFTKLWLYMWCICLCVHVCVLCATDSSGICRYRRYRDLCVLRLVLGVEEEIEKCFSIGSRSIWSINKSRRIRRHALRICLAKNANEALTLSTQRPFTSPLSPPVRLSLATSLPEVANSFLYCKRQLPRESRRTSRTQRNSLLGSAVKQLDNRTDRSRTDQIRTDWNGTENIYRYSG